MKHLNLSTMIGFVSLNTEVFDAVKKAELTAIQEDVYDAYTPHKYVRRKARGGLLDQSHIVLIHKSEQNRVRFQGKNRSLHLFKHK